MVSSWFSSFGDAPGGFSEELKEFQISVGAEYTYNDQFSFRAGYFYEAPTKGDRKYFTVGAGLNYNMFGLNFSYLIPSGSGINRNPLSNTLRFSIFLILINQPRQERLIIIILFEIYLNASVLRRFFILALVEGSNRISEKFCCVAQ